MTTPKPVLISTDIGDDIDDSLAISYCDRHPDIEIIGILLAHGEYERRQQFIQELFEVLQSALPPLGTADNLEAFAEQISTSEPLHILSIGPTDELRQLLQQKELDIAQLIQQGFVDEHGLPVPICYNFEHTPESAKKLLQGKCPKKTIGKYAAYQAALTHDDFSQLAQASELGKHLYQQAKHRIQRFEELHPTKREQTYQAHPDILSFPYDLTAANALTNPEDFTRNTQGPVHITGNRPNPPALQDSQKRKDETLIFLR